MSLNFIKIIAAFICGISTCTASMTISGTRIIFPGSEKDVSVRTNNKGNQPALVQVWVDDGKTDSNINTVKVPFVVTPPVYRVEPGRGQSVRLVYNGMVLPQDRESVYWFNMLEIPPAPVGSVKKNRLELAFRTRIKIFFRPQTLASNSEASVDKLRWKMITDSEKGVGVEVTNTTPYFFSFDTAKLNTKNSKIELMMDMVAPGATAKFYPAKKLTNSVSVNSVNFWLLNDYGASVMKTLKPGDGGFLSLTEK
ncbi:fimbria/pilus periplasmic chaperone [Cronobacter malonaticus]|uniref:Pilus assembly protein n=3 Tax=Cronobacter malonaticus TaxID=413503 RepID=A0A423Y4Q9_9ENTR|nr:fimbria/pilus periplasmic chaperone [Cronobacter malonaticus]EGT4372161.1 pilus assembly protein [Cronobacter malonaticus]EGT4445755.1 pilus assembly protein [Cronobacter malonaticus]EKP4390059.1 fimbria/pilus periplasmic chaperone [Cronobacter malonaticus]EKY3233939.1 fimbria/pilus periplasmic chaperone [Cronobacter malonaticus]ELY2514239.1 fimbria/pilus periplasmic chaperone [Cronobacter malonaticus]